jgi:hypothetical protein
MRSVRRLVVVTLLSLSLTAPSFAMISRDEDGWTRDPIKRIVTLLKWHFTAPLDEIVIPHP